MEEMKGEAPEDSTPLGKMDAETEELSNILDEAQAASMPSGDVERIEIMDDESVISGQDEIIHNTREEADY